MLGLGIFGPGIATGLVSGAPQLGAGAAVGTGLAVAGTAMAGAGGLGLAGRGAMAAASGSAAAARGGAAMAGGASTAYSLASAGGPALRALPRALAASAAPRRRRPQRQCGARRLEPAGSMREALPPARGPPLPPRADRRRQERSAAARQAAADAGVQRIQSARLGAADGRNQSIAQARQPPRTRSSPATAMAAAIPSISRENRHGAVSPSLGSLRPHARTRTPYQRAAQVWDERIGSARVQAKNWRLMAFGSLALSLSLAGGLVWQSTHGSVVPWVVQVDKLGQAQAVAPATADYAPSDPQIAWYLAHFIEMVRSLPADPIIVRQNWLQAYDFTTDLGLAGAQRLRPRQ